MSSEAPEAVFAAQLDSALSMSSNSGTYAMGEPGHDRHMRFIQIIQTMTPSRMDSKV
jgi:hypothetical protein